MVNKLMNSIGVSSLFGSLGSIVESGQGAEFVTSKIAFEVIGSSSSISQFHQEIEHIILAGILSFVVFSVARISLVVLLVFNVIELGVSLIVINQVASEPSFKSQTAQHVVILHLIESLGGNNGSLSG